MKEVNSGKENEICILVNIEEAEVIMLHLHLLTDSDSTIIVNSCHLESHTRIVRSLFDTLSEDILGGGQSTHCMENVVFRVKVLLEHLHGQILS